MPGLSTTMTAAAPKGRYSTRNRGLAALGDIRQAAGEAGALNSIARPRASMFQPGYSIAEGDRAANERRGATLLQHQVEQQNRAQSMAEQAQTFGQDQQAQQNARAWASHALGLKQGEQGLQLAGRADTRAQGAYEQNQAQGTAAEIRRAYSFSRQQQIDAETDPLRKKALQLELARQEAELDALPEEQRQRKLQQFINGEVLQDRWDSLPADKKERDDIRNYNGEMRKVGLDAAKAAAGGGVAGAGGSGGGGLSQYKGKAGNMGVAMARKAGFEIPDDKNATAEFDETIGWLRQHNPQASMAELAQQAAKELGYSTLDEEIAKQQKIIGKRGLLAGNGLVWDSAEVDQAQAKLAELQKRKAEMGGGLQGQPAGVGAGAAGASAGAAAVGAAPAAPGAALAKPAAMAPEVVQAYQGALAEGKPQEKAQALAEIQKAVEAGTMSKVEAFNLLPADVQQQAMQGIGGRWKTAKEQQGLSETPDEKQRVWAVKALAKKFYGVSMDENFLTHRLKQAGLTPDQIQLLIQDAGSQGLKEHDDEVKGAAFDAAMPIFGGMISRSPMQSAPDNQQQAAVRAVLEKQKQARGGGLKPPEAGPAPAGTGQKMGGRRARALERDRAPADVETLLQGLTPAQLDELRRRISANPPM
jgi:hypothetical protein